MSTGSTGGRGCRAWLLLGAALALLPGCISRKLFVRSDPPGATVILDGVPVGTTPYEEEIPAYGTRRLELALAGHERLVIDLVLATPWYEYWPLDLVTELALPFTVRDHRAYDFELRPAAPASLDWPAAEAAWGRAQALRPQPEAEEEEE